MKTVLKTFITLILLLSFMQNNVFSGVTAAESTESLPSQPIGLTAEPHDSQQVELNWIAGLGKQILYVGTGNQADEMTMNHFKSLGFSITFKEDKEVTGEDAASYDLVFVGESSNSSNIGNKFIDASVPVVYAEPFALDDAYLSEATSGSFGSYENQDSLEIKTSDHSLAAGLSDTVKVYDQAGKINYGAPGEEAITIATAADDDSKATIFAYEKGAKNVNGDPVPARQVATFLFAGQEEYMTEEGWKLLDQSVMWALGMDNVDHNITYTIKRSTEDEGPYEVVATDITETSYIDNELKNHTTYYYVISAVNAAAESEDSEQVSVTPIEIPDPPAVPTDLTAIERNSQVDLTWNAGDRKQILFVGTGIPADDKTINHLESLGFDVSFIKDNEVSGEDALSYDLVFVGESSGSAYIGKKFMDSSVPVVYAEPYALDDVQLSEAESGMFGSYENQESITIHDSEHPLAAGLSGTINVYDQTGKVNFGSPGEEAITIATAADDDSKATIFAYEKGAKNVNGDPVPARQVATFLFAGQEDVMTEDGWKLIDTSVKWALGMEDKYTYKESYNVKRSTTEEGPYETIAENIEKMTFRDTELENDQRYYYVVSAENIGGEGNDSSEVSALPVAPLQAPTDLSASNGNEEVTISWEPVDGATTYQVLRSKEKGMSYEVIENAATETEYTDTDLTEGETYYYVVSAKSETSQSANSDPVRGVAIPQSGVPAIPNGIEATAGDGQVVLTWPSVSGADAYNIKRGSFGSGEYEVIASDVSLTSYQDAGITNGETYDYVISAVNDSGESVDSEPLAVTPTKVTVVAKEGGDFSTVQEAIDAAPDDSSNRHVIYIKDGEYREKLTVPESKTNLSFVGESKEGTVLVYDDNANTTGPDGNPLGTSKSSSVFIYADDFIAKNLTIENDSGQGTGQAVAAYVAGNRAYFENVMFLGYQDTLYTHSGSQYYKNCYIEGDVDFIFGGATAVFDNCQIHSNRDGSMLTAASTPQENPFGYVFLNSEITSDEGIEDVRFGRPWRPYSAVSFINTAMDASIASDGWDNWGEQANEETARYSEYNSSGPGSNPKMRDSWTKQLTPEEANQYTVQNVFQKSDGWNPTRIGVIPLSAISAPMILLDQQDAIVNKSSFTISGKVDKEATVYVDDKEIPVEEDLSFSVKVELESGLNTFTVEAVDSDGNQSVPTILKVDYDHEKPVITVDDLDGEEKGNHYNVMYNPFPITGMLNEAGSLKINGEEIALSDDLVFSSEIDLESGLNKVTITAVDRAGNESDPVTVNLVPKGSSVPDGPIKILQSEVISSNTVEVTFNSKLKNFDSSDIELQLAMNSWEDLDPGLESNVTVENISTRINKDKQTVAVIETKESFKEDGTIDKPIQEDPNNIPYLNAPYYTGDRANDIKQADALLSWQMDHGGWYKNMEDKYNRPWDGEEPKSEMYDPEHGELGVIDNNATTNEILFLALMYNETGDSRYKESVLNGINYLLEAQYDTGGWPQAYPARGNYSDYATYNDNAMIRVMNVLTMVSQKEYPFNTDIVTEGISEQVDGSLDLGVEYILKSQITVDGVLTAWCAQHDPVTYEPKEARSYEHPSISGSESVGIVQYLMSLPNPSNEVQAAIDGALSWFEEAKVEGIKYVSADPEGQYFYSDSTTNTWYRFYEIGTNRPIFSGRDGVIKHEILEIEQERRDGYRWAGEWPQKILDIANSTGYYEDRVYLKVVGENSQNAAGETLEKGNLYRVESANSSK
ncbi:pectate lyase, PelA/Pel-15E family [Gracilibacillus orientalis]|uniref:Pectate lyase, PelA/Pel-15E family n=1 Tax=Gracilibacillus orientalis TaxID=334253 RepID=A0A1I4IZR3_9BACI|nr:pectate lyase [Gracilibacillus orientalis]SFL59361.1 pectate lyase, PelA/Pel-15E family [Gracilibacillus orientalis]